MGVPTNWEAVQANATVVMMVIAFLQATGSFRLVKEATKRPGGLVDAIITGIWLACVVFYFS